MRCKNVSVTAWWHLVIMGDYVMHAKTILALIRAVEKEFYGVIARRTASLNDNFCSLIRCLIAHL